MREYNCVVRNVSFDFYGWFVVVFCIDGIVYVYFMIVEEFELIWKVDGIIGIVDSDVDMKFIEVRWYLDGRMFVVVMFIYNF